MIDGGPGTNRTLIWRSRPIFVSSTFRDMHAERDHLRLVAFPLLEERLRERFHLLEPVDLRWGVETVSLAEQQDKELLVLKVCLSEIERCRPFLIAVLGDRYGWVPPEERSRAAADEAGFSRSVAGKSITALEIEFGVLDNEEQGRKSFFYLREPLPYAAMDRETAALYSDAFALDPETRALSTCLLALKQRIRDELPDRTRTYAAEWDPIGKRVTGLEEWGRQVVEDLWPALEAESAEFARPAALSWQDEERWLLEEFGERSGRDFVGREEVLDRLSDLALSRPRPESPWGVCIVGPPGSGKSAVASQLKGRLTERALVLAHAAGAGPRAIQVDVLLRRWLEELATFLGVPDPAPDLARPEELHEAFRALLTRASSRRRVVCILDGLDGFERTTTASHLTWLPLPWPENACLIATATPGTETAALVERGIELLPLRPLNDVEVEGILSRVCARHRKTLHPQVREALLAKTGPHGSPARGNPLWLLLALDELLLLDADDFRRADREFSGSPYERLHALLLTIAQGLPADIESLYDHLLQRNERVHGVAWARAFACLIAVSRDGLREADLARLLPVEVGQPWDGLRFAALRRSFRAHLAQRGALLQWDFVHAQMRQAVVQRYLFDTAERKRLHAAIANHLEGLPQDDGLRLSELMAHYLGADDCARAARHYGSDLSPGQEEGATSALVRSLVPSSDHTPSQSREWVASLLGESSLERHSIQRACRRFTHSLALALSREVDLATCRFLLEAAGRALARLSTEDPEDASILHDRSLHGRIIGNVV